MGVGRVQVEVLSTPVAQVLTTCLARPGLGVLPQFPSIVLLHSVTPAHGRWGFLGK